MIKSLLLLAISAIVHAKTRLGNQQYVQVNGNAGVNSCTRLLNASMMIGCTSPESGAVGVLFRIASDADFTVFDQAPADQYIALIPLSYFALPTTITRLIGYSKYQGAFIYNDNITVSYSPDNLQPNADYGLSSGLTVNWNSAGGGFGPGGILGSHWQDYGDKPFFLLTDSDRDMILAKYNQTNTFSVSNTNPAYPLWGAQLFDFMWAVRDANLCLMRQQCDPISGQNVYATTKLFTQGEEVVMVAAQMDSMAFFHDSSFGADADASGLVALLGAASLLNMPGNSALVRQLPRNIMYMLFTGESFGYIGSSRLAFDMMQSPSAFPGSGLSLNFSSVKYYLELNQVLLTSQNLYAYTYSNDSTDAETVISTLAAAATNLGYSDVGIVNQTTQPLPPSSLRGLLHEMHNTTMENAFGAVVLADHPATGYTNLQYHSSTDDGSNIDVSDSATITRLCHVATVLAKTIWALAASISVDNVPWVETQANCTYIQTLLNCITVNQTCDLANAAVGNQATANIPMSRYTGVTRDSNVMSRSTGFFYNILGAAVAVNDSISVGSCAASNTPGQYQNVPWNNGTCMNSTVYAYYVRSPAFESYYSLKSDRDPRWSTWTESTWGYTSARIYLVENPGQQLGALLGGLAWFMLSLASGYVISKYFQQSPESLATWSGEPTTPQSPNFAVVPLVPN